MQRGSISTTMLIGIVIVLVLISGLLLALSRSSAENKLLSITSFDGCAAAGYPVEESYPEQCRTPDGRVFVRSIESDKQATSSAASSDAPDHPVVPIGVQPAY